MSRFLSWALTAGSLGCGGIRMERGNNNATLMRNADYFDDQANNECVDVQARALTFLNFNFKEI
jgi:hypothetical protein